VAGADVLLLCDVEVDNLEEQAGLRTDALHSLLQARLVEAYDVMSVCWTLKRGGQVCLTSADPTRIDSHH